jgi:DNA-binding transcriptional ArsR family regulator
LFEYHRTIAIRDGIWYAARVRGFKHPRIEDVPLELVFHALSDPVRLDIVRQLAATSEASCHALNAGRPKSSMSHHFRVLRDAGLVRTRTQGTSHANALRRGELDGRFPGLIDALLEAMATDDRANAEAASPDGRPLGIVDVGREAEK